MNPYFLPGAEDWGVPQDPDPSSGAHWGSGDRGSPPLFYPHSFFPIAVTAASGCVACALPIPRVPSQGNEVGAGADVGGQGGVLVCRVPSWAPLFAPSRPAGRRIKGAVFCSSLKGERAGLLWRLPASSCPLGPGWVPLGPGWVPLGAGSCWGYPGAPGGPWWKAAARRRSLSPGQARGKDG